MTQGGERNQVPMCYKYISEKTSKQVSVRESRSTNVAQYVTFQKAHAGQFETEIKLLCYTTDIKRRRREWVHAETKVRKHTTETNQCYLGGDITVAAGLPRLPNSVAMWSSF